ncbi:unnamed protein product [Gadus morhua 'NCC']
MHPVALVQRAQPLAPTGGRTQSSHGPTPGVSAMEPSENHVPHREANQRGSQPLAIASRYLAGDGPRRAVQTCVGSLSRAF